MMQIYVTSWRVNLTYCLVSLVCLLGRLDPTCARQSEGSVWDKQEMAKFEVCLGEGGGRDGGGGSGGEGAVCRAHLDPSAVYLPSDTQLT